MSSTMVNEKKDPGDVGLQIDPPSPCRPSHIPSGTKVHFLMATNLPNLPKPLTLDEKKYLLSVERGDLANVRRMLQRAIRRQNININCVDSLGRGALTIAIDGENLEMVELLVIMGVETRDALLQAINAEFVEAVELLLEHEELIHKEGELYSWQKVEMNTSMFTPDITPLILAAHRNNYEILKILLDRGATIPMPHDVRCGCDECIRLSTEDSLRHSLSRVNEYRALASPSLIALSSNDPLLTAFQLSWELRNLAFAEQESKSEYLLLRRQCQQFAVDLLDQSRSSQELAIILNYDPDAPPYNDGDHMKLARLELAINYKQKKFVAHPNIQQLLASLWYEGVPGFRRKSSLIKLMIIARVAIMFPFYCLLYMIAPNCSMGIIMKKPFMKFLIHASSYLFFLLILILVSQRAEFHLINLLGSSAMKENLKEELSRQRGNGPTPLELVVVLYVLGFIWEETQEIYLEGIKSYLRNMWNFIDFSRNLIYTIVALLRVVAYIQQRKEIEENPSTAYIPREDWTAFDPQLIAEGLFAAANIFSALKIVHLFSINPHLGPLQISLGRMVIDIVKFFFIYSLVLFAFACGLNQLLWYFADLEKQKCYALPNETADWENAGDSCMKWRRFGNLFESSQSLFWASFGMVGLENFELQGIKSYTRFWGLLMFGSYCVINVIVLLNLLIAMMSNSYAMIDEHSDTEWKFARTKLWMSYFDESATLPPPFNVLPSIKWFTRICRKKPNKNYKRGSTIRRKEDRENRYLNVMRSLVWRYVSSTHRKCEESLVTEDDINEVKGDISAMRYEILEIFERNGMDISSADKKEKAHLAKRIKIWERRLMKDFHVAPVTTDDDDPPQTEEKGIARFRRVARQIVNQTNSHKWGETVKAVRDTQIGRCNRKDGFKNQQNLQKAMNEAKRFVARSPLPRSGSCSPIEFIDPTHSTLLELLKNLTEETSLMPSPRHGKKSKIKNQKIDTSPVATLTKHLQQLARNRSPSPSISPDAKQFLSAPINSSYIIDRSKEQAPINQSESKRETSGNSSSSSLDKCTRLTPPVIQISEISSPIKRSQKNKEIISTDKNSPTTINDKDDLLILTNSNNIDDNDIKEKEQAPKHLDKIYQRPIAIMPRNGKSMIPPPPKSKRNADNISDIQTVTAIDTSITSSKSAKQESERDTVEPLIYNSDPNLVELNPPGSTSSTNSCELLIRSESGTEISYSQPKNISPEKSPVGSPSLRPYRKIEDITTIKRQPRNGWL